MSYYQLNDVTYKLMTDFTFGMSELFEAGLMIRVSSWQRELESKKKPIRIRYEK